MLKIMVINPEFLPIPAVMGGAVETLLTSLVEENEKESGIQFIVISPKEGISKKQKKKYRHTAIKYLKSRGLIHKVFEWIAYQLSHKLNIPVPFNKIYYLRAYLEAITTHPDFIIAEGLGWWDMRIFSRKFGREKVILHLHHEVESDVCYREVYGRVIAVSDYIKGAWLRGDSVPPANVHVVKNGIDFSRFQKKISSKEQEEWKRKVHIEGNDFVAMYSGRLVLVKGVKELALAWQYISDRNIKLLVVGGTNFADSKPSPYLKELQELAKKDERIQLVGYVDNRYMQQYYAIADVVVVPSLCEEAAGLSAIEAMVCGKPLIVTKSGGLCEYVGASCSIQLERDEELSVHIAQAILKLRGDKILSEELGFSAKKAAMEYSSRNYYRHMRDLLFEIAKKEEKGIDGQKKYCN